MWYLCIVLFISEQVPLGILLSDENNVPEMAQIFNGEAAGVCSKSVKRRSDRS